MNHDRRRGLSAQGLLPVLAAACLLATLAGILASLSPCVLPILPIVLVASLTGALIHGGGVLAGRGAFGDPARKRPSGARAS